MPRPALLKAFSEAEYKTARRALAMHVANMRGRKMEEQDWAKVYCLAKGIPDSGWSNLSIDMNHAGVGIEHKMLRASSDKPILAECGKRRMHPSSTRSIRLDYTGQDAEYAMVDVLGQYAELIQRHKNEVAAESPDGSADLRHGLLIWREDLAEFLYFEEEWSVPPTEEFYARWNTQKTRGKRKSSTNLWIYERDTDLKRYSVTTSAGPKVQPYFDIPDANSDALYHFRVQGDSVSDGRVQIWAPRSALAELRKFAGGDTEEAASEFVINAAEAYEADIEDGGVQADERPRIAEQTISAGAYAKMKQAFPAASDGENLEKLLEWHRDQA